jgi:pyridoxal biosynthesis lyase PdxS
MALAACSGEPGAGDMKQAIKNNQMVMSQLQMFAQMGGASMSAAQMLDASEVEKSGCTAAQGQPGFICDFRLNTTVNGQRQPGQWGKARFFNAGGWQMEQIQ